MNKIAIFIPTYKRPHELARVAKNIEDNTLNPYTLYFGLEKDDPQGLAAAKATGARAVINAYEPGYSNTIQTLYENSLEPYILHANDDFEFTHNWDEIPLSMFTPPIEVVGLRQTESDNHGSAISMFKRSYIKESSGVADMPNRVFYPYHHNFIDTEFTRTAQKRGVWAKCDKLLIHHLHPGFTGREKDETYRKNDATVELDRQTFESRRHIWA